MLNANQDLVIKRYLVNDKVLNTISKRFISLDRKNVEETNEHIKRAYTELINIMKNQNQLFAKTYQEVVWAGSFYKQTKVGSPDEFDLNLIIKLPIEEKNIQFTSYSSCYTKIRVTDIHTDRLCNNLKQNYPEAHREMMRFIDNSYLNQEKFRRWMEKIFSKIADQRDGHIRFCTYNIKVRKAGPAFTMELLISGETNPISIDLVPVLAFSSSQLPPYSNRHMIKDFNRNSFVVPKPLIRRNYGVFDNTDYYWRISFYMFEKDMLREHGRVKPIIRFLKKFRDTCGWKSIASYYIETLCLHELHNFKNAESITSLFFLMLTKLHKAFQHHEIKCYWDINLNLLERIEVSEMQNMERRLFHILKDIKNQIISNPEDLLIIAKYVLNPAELEKLESIVRNEELEPNSIPDNANQWQCTIV